MRFGLVVVLLLLVSTAFAQTDRGTITGTISDPSEAIVPNASIEARNIETAQVYRGTSTGTGNYTLVQLPTGTYDLSVNVQGFKKYLRKGLALATAQVLRRRLCLR